MICTIVNVHGFTWDEKKKRANPRRHSGASFELAQEVFDDPHHVVLETISSRRKVSSGCRLSGMSRNLVLLLVIFVDLAANGEVVIHIISARKATAYEQSIYQDQFRQTAEGQPGN